MSRVQAGLLILVAVPVLWGLMWWGWRGRARRQAGVAQLPTTPEGFTPDVMAPAEATYVTTTTAGDWLDRVVAHGLGVRSAAQVSVGRAGLLVVRQGAPDVWVPAAALHGVRRERGMAGKYVEKEGLVVVTWKHGEAYLDTGLRLRRSDDAALLEQALAGLSGVTP